jgi:hypothetical protein
MKLFKSLLLLFLLIVLLALGCQKELSFEGGNNLPENNEGAGPVKSEWEFTETKKYAGPVDTAFLTNQDKGQILTATGKSVSGDEKIFISIKTTNELIQKGATYKTSSLEVKFLYTDLSDLNDTLYSAIPYYGGDIYVTITDIQPDRIVGTFSGLALDKDNKSQNIINGKFSSPLKAVTGSEAKGYIMLWAKEDCNGPIKVKVNNQPGEISTFTSIVPDCGDAGRATYSLTPGIYDWVAYCGRDSVIGKAEVKAGSCSKILITFPFKPPAETETNNDTCKISYISYSGCLFNRCDPTQTYKPIHNTNISAFDNTTVSSMLYTVYAVGFPITYSHPVSYGVGKIIIDEGTQNESYFLTDGQGRVINYHGLKDPATIGPPDSTIITYEYDNNNYLVKRIVTDARYLVPKKETNFIWQNGNVIKIIEYNLASGGKNETDFEYYTDKEVRSLPFTFNNAFELLLLQPAINFGKHLKNPLREQIVHAQDINGNPVLNSIYFTNYILDDNNYV